VGLRKALDLYSNLRPVNNLRGIESRFDNVDLIIVRENTEDLYAGLEHVVVPGVVESLKIITAGLGAHRAFAFKYARQWGRKRVTAIHKANIMKLGDGLFLESVRGVSREFPDITYDERIVDAACMHLVMTPEKFDVLLLPNLYGDIVSDLCAGLVGGLGVVPGANLGEHIAVFEAVHGSAPDIAGQGIANPMALLLSALMMLRHLGEDAAAADRIRAALERVLVKAETLTRDLGGTATTLAFTDAVCREDRSRALNLEPCGIDAGRDHPGHPRAGGRWTLPQGRPRPDRAAGARAHLCVPRRAADDAALSDLPRAQAPALPDPAQGGAPAEGIDIVRRATAEGRVMYISNHKSHLDYLVEPLVLDDHGIRPPVIAAGINLFGGPLGLLHRHVTGAVPIRRDAKDPAYLVTLKAYVAELLKRHDLLFYLEGGRSYSGEMKSPKTGLLHAAVQAGIEDLVIVPTAIAYDLVLEDRNLARQGAKRRQRPFTRTGRDGRVGGRLPLARLRDLRRADSPGGLERGIETGSDDPRVDRARGPRPPAQGAAVGHRGDRRQAVAAAPGHRGPGGRARVGPGRGGREPRVARRGRRDGARAADARGS
jgi:isocitrate dehydrogenase (NAD+)